MLPLAERRAVGERRAYALLSGSPIKAGLAFGLFESRGQPQRTASSSRETKEGIVARERLTSYRGRMSIKLSWQLNGNQPAHVETRECGLLPIMVRVSTQALLGETCSNGLASRLFIVRAV